MAGPKQPGTHLGNKDTHPGQVVKDNAITCQTKEQMDAAHKLEAENKKAADLVHMGKIKHLADIQEYMQQCDSEEQSAPAGKLPPKHCK